MGGNRTPIIEQNLLDGDSKSWIREYHMHLRYGGEPLPFESPVSPNLRRLTVEEAAVLQGFPVGMKFSGPTTAQFRQIGNSVAPPLAQKVAEHLLPFVVPGPNRKTVPTLSTSELIRFAEDAFLGEAGQLWLEMGAKDSSLDSEPQFA
jgi:DNA (cytosine-5)-methyltransferase 1